MEEGGYAASGLKHCVRPVDMAGAPLAWTAMVLICP